MGGVRGKLREYPKKIREFLREIQTVEYPPQGYTSTVSKVDSSNGTFIIKHVKGQQFSEWLAYENEMLKLISGLNIPTPNSHILLRKVIKKKYQLG